MKSKLRLFPPEEILILIFDFIEISERLLDFNHLSLVKHPKQFFNNQPLWKKTTVLYT